MFDIPTYISKLEGELDRHQSSELAHSQSSYMRDQFPFLGITKPHLVKIIHPFLGQLKGRSPEELCAVIDSLWEKPQREYQYTALLITQKYTKIFTEDHIAFFKHLIVRKSWWDTVDVIAPHIIGSIIMRYPDRISEVASWNSHEHMWVRRSSLIFQLRCKDHTHAQILFDNCVLLMHEQEFFIRKAIGWALREYSKINPHEVRTFVDKHLARLSPLSYREATKYC